MEQLTFQNILTAIGSVGFPIIMCLVLIFRIEKCLKELTVAVNGFTTALYNTTFHPVEPPK